MAKYCIYCFILFNSAIAFGQYAEFDFSKRIVKLDPILEGNIVEWDFQFQNSGNVPLLVGNYEVACTCTQVTYPKHPIPPDSSATIHVIFDSEGKTGWQYRKIELFANTKKNPTVIEFRVKVEDE